MEPGLENGGSPLATGAGRMELGLVTGAEQAPQGRLLPWMWPALSWEQDGTWWQVGVEVLEAPFSHS